MPPLRALARLHGRPCLHAAAIGVVAMLLQAVIHVWLGPRVPFLLFLPAILLAVAWCGAAAGAGVLALGMLSSWFWLPPTGSLHIASTEDRMTIVLFTIVGLSLIAAGARFRASRVRAVAAEGRLVLAVQDTGIGLFEIDLLVGTFYLSPSLAGLVGLAPSDHPRPLRELWAQVPSDWVAQSRAVLADKIHERADTYEREIEVVDGAGNPRALLLRAHIEWRGERAAMLRGAAIDITERREMDAQLQQTRLDLSQQVADLRRLHDLSSRLVETTALTLQLQMILHALCEFHGIARGLVCLLLPDGRSLEIAARVGFDDGDDVLLGGRSDGEGACSLACTTAQPVVIADTERDPRFAPRRDLARRLGFRAVHSTPLMSQEGRVLGAISVHFDQPHTPDERERALADICARKAAVFIERSRAQSALREIESRHHAVLEASAVPFALLTPLRDAAGNLLDFRWTYLNSAAGQVLGQAPAALLQQRLLEVFPQVRHEPALWQPLTAVADRAETRAFDYAAGAGEAQWFHCIVSPVRDSVAVWFADVTERKLGERRLQEEDRRKDEFLAVLAHELRNPLAPIGLGAELLRAGARQGVDLQRTAAMIQSQVKHMARLLDDLMDASRIKHGGLRLQKQPTSTRGVVEMALQSARPAIDAKGHRLSLQIRDDPPLVADPVRLAQVLSNLLTNAAKYTDVGGHIELRVATVDGQLEFRVRDNGMGLEPEALERIFQMFSQESTALDRSEGGLGIGLALVRAIVSQHGGTVHAASEGPGRGSAFHVRVPLPETPALAALALPPQAGASQQGSLDVLVADDNVSAGQLLAELLEAEGYRVRVATDGAQALALARSFRPQVAVLDIGMPQLNGYEVAEALRREFPAPSIRLIAATGWGQQADRERAAQAGFDVHLTKPFDPRELLDELARTAARIDACEAGATHAASSAGGEVAASLDCLGVTASAASTALPMSGALPD